MSEQKYKIGDAYDLLKELPSKSIDLILTDPPYGIKVSAKSVSLRGKAKITQHKDFNWDQNRLEKKYFDEMLRVSKNQIIFGGNYYTDYLYPTSCWIVWHKDNGDSNFSDCDLAWGSFKTSIRYFKHRWHGMLQEDMSHKEEKLYPTQKPLKLFEWILKKYSNENDLICDPFLGSGTTLRACMNTNRNCIGFEINPDCEKIYKERLMVNQVRFL